MKHRYHSLEHCYIKPIAHSKQPRDWYGSQTSALEHIARAETKIVDVRPKTQNLRENVLSTPPAEGYRKRMHPTGVTIKKESPVSRPPPCASSFYFKVCSGPRCFNAHNLLSANLNTFTLHIPSTPSATSSIVASATPRSASKYGSVVSQL